MTSSAHAKPPSCKPVIGVLALQGAFRAHKPHIQAAGGEFREVKAAEEILSADALILPGGESSTMLKLIDRFDLEDALSTVFQTKPIWGVCAGSILMAKTVTNPAQKSFNLLPIDVERNGYGRQIDSHYDEIDGYQVSFIRAPIITSIDETLDIRASQGDIPVWVQSGNRMATTFHPELNPDAPSPMHRAFFEMIDKDLSRKAA